VETTSPVLEPWFIELGGATLVVGARLNVELATDSREVFWLHRAL
jgi:hypothetical protein